MSKRNEKPGLRWGPVLRRLDQAALACLTLASLSAIGGYWLAHRGAGGGLIEIDRVEPRTAAFKVDINRAAWPEIAELPEIGETLARRIIASREADGTFADAQQLRRVRGIGPITLERIKPYLLPLPGRGSVAGK